MSKTFIRSGNGSNRQKQQLAQKSLNKVDQLLSNERTNNVKLDAINQQIRQDELAQDVKDLRSAAAAEKKDPGFKIEDQSKILLQQAVKETTQSATLSDQARNLLVNSKTASDAAQVAKKLPTDNTKEGTKLGENAIVSQALAEENKRHFQVTKISEDNAVRNELTDAKKDTNVDIKDKNKADMELSEQDMEQESKGKKAAEEKHKELVENIDPANIKPIEDPKQFSPLEMQKIVKQKHPGKQTNLHKNALREIEHIKTKKIENDAIAKLKTAINKMTPPKSYNKLKSKFKRS